LNIKEYREQVRNYYRGDIDRNDTAHNLKHCDAVCDRMLDMNIFLDYDIDEELIVLTAYLHDIKCHISRKKHHILSALYVMINKEIDPYLMKVKDIDELSVAILSHRASLGTHLTNDLSRLLYIADKDVPDIVDIVNRSYDYSGNVYDVLKHVKEKFSKDGYLVYPVEYVAYYGDDKINELYDNVDMLTLNDVVEIINL